MVKFPSQNKLMYVQQNGVSNDAWTGAQSGGQSGELNLPKDLSILNRRGYASTHKGVPLVYRCKFDLYSTNYDGTGTSAAVGSDFLTTMRIEGVQNNWVMRNAAVKWHAARANMWKKAGVKRKDLGSWAKEIRYNYDAYNDTWINPVDGHGAAFTGGTWDTTHIVDMIDNEYTLRLTGTGVDEDSSTSTTALNIAHSYLSSRATVPADSNLESSEVPAPFSHLVQLLSPTNLESGTEEAYIRTDAQTEQDNPPYEVFATETVDHDCTEPVELGRVLVGPGSGGMSSIIVDVPFGLAKLQLQHYDAADTDTTHNPMWTVEVLDMFEMQG